MFRESRIFALRDTWVDVMKNNTIQMLQDQLSFFGFAFTKPESMFQTEKYTISGKAAGSKDDLCMAFLIGIYFAADKTLVVR